MALNRQGETVGGALGEQEDVVHKKDEEVKREVKRVQGKLDAAEDELSGLRMDLEQLQQDVKKWKSKHDDIAQKTRGHDKMVKELEQVKADNLSLSAEVEQFETENDTLNSELGREQQMTIEHKQKIAELINKIELLEKPDSLGIELFRMNSRLKEQVRAQEEELEQTKNELEQAEHIRDNQASTLATAQEDCSQLRELIPHLICHAANPVGVPLDFACLKPFLRLNNTLRNVIISVDKYVGRPQVTLAKWYVTQNGASGELRMLDILAVGLDVNMSHMDDMSAAIALQGLVGSHTFEPDPTSVSALYQYALTQAQFSSTSAFAVVCAVLEDLHSRFPLTDPEEASDLLECMLTRKYAVGDLLIDSKVPLLEQLCIYRLTVAMETSASAILHCCRKVNTRIGVKKCTGEYDENLVKNLHIPELAAYLFDDLPLEPDMGVATHRAAGWFLVTIHDSQGSYIFWEDDYSPGWVFSTKGMDVKVSEGSSDEDWDFICTAAGIDPSSKVSGFDLKIVSAHSEKKKKKNPRMAVYLEKYYSDITDAAWRKYGEQQVELMSSDEMDDSA